MNTLPRWQKKDNFRRAPAQALVNAVNELSTISPGEGGETLRTPFGTAVIPEETVAPPFYINARITGSTRDGSNWRWTYDFVESEKTSTGYDGWEDVTDGITGTAYNRAEAINGTAGLMGNGVNIDTLPDGFEMQPIPDDTPVRLEAIIVNGETELEWWFSMPNGIDGECE